MLDTGRTARPREAVPDTATLVDQAETRRSLRFTVRSLLQYRELLRNLVVKDLKLKYRGSVLGFLWSLANPLLMLVVYTIAFRYVLKVHSEGFVLCLLVGLLAWTFFSNTTSMATGAIADNGGLVKTVYFPRAILPIATVLFNFAQYLLNVAVLLPVMLLLYQMPLATPMLAFPIFVGLQLLFMVGVALWVATGTAFFRDLKHLLEVGLAALFWATPVLYQIEQVPASLSLPVRLAPLSPFVIAYQRMFFYREWPEPSVWILAVTYTVIALVGGLSLLTRFEERFAELV